MNAASGQLRNVIAHVLTRARHYPSSWRWYATSMVCAAIVFGTIAMVNLAGASVDRDLLAQRVRTAFANGQLRDEALARDDWRRGINQFNDCLVLQSTLLVRGSPLADAISTRVLTDQQPCNRLRDIANGIVSEPSRVFEYNRYVFGARGISALAMQVASVRVVRRVSSLLLYVLLAYSLVGGIAYATGHWREGPRTGVRPRDPDRILFGLVVSSASAGLLALYGLHLFARNLGHVYSEIVIAIFLLAALIAGHRCSRGRDTVLAALFGAWTACFELLTGPVVVGAVLVGLVAMAQRDNRPGSHLVRNTLRAIAAFLLAFVMVLLAQQLAAALVTGRNTLHEFAVHLALRVQLIDALGLMLPPGWQTPANLATYGPLEIGGAVVRALPLLAYGSLSVAFAMSAVAAIAAALGIGWAIRSGDPVARSRVLAITALMAIVPAWYLAFGNHTSLHSLYMVRLVTLEWICSAVLLLVGRLAFAERTHRDVVTAAPTDVGQSPRPFSRPAARGTRALSRAARAD